MQGNCKVFELIKYIFFSLPLELNKQIISVLQTFVGTWGKMEVRERVREGSQKSWR
jgi:hypothetical protein